MEAEDSSKVDVLCELLIKSDNYGVKYEIGEILKNILETEMRNSLNEKMTNFCSKVFGFISHYLSSIKSIESKADSATVEVFIEFLSFFVRLNWENARYFLSLYDILPKVVNTMNYKSKSLKIYVIKFIKLVVEINVVT